MAHEYPAVLKYSFNIIDCGFWYKPSTCLFLVISLYFNLRNFLPKSGTFLSGHSVYIYIYIYIFYIYTLYIYIYIQTYKDFSRRLHSSRLGNERRKFW